jgi:hypothetical protein
MVKLIISLILFISVQAHAIKTASSFDFSYGITSLTLTTQEANAAKSPLVRTISSKTGFEVNYNVAMFDYRTVATMSFMQYATSSLGNMPLNRVSLGASYHFIRVNGQRVVLDNGVEGKIWGISPAIELTVGLNKLSINDVDNQSYNFTAAFVDLLPRILLEIPLSSSFLLLIRGGYLFSASGSQLFNIKYAGSTINVGFRLTTS